MLDRYAWRDAVTFAVEYYLRICIEDIQKRQTHLYTR